jgi:hypothetical protein
MQLGNLFLVPGEWLPAAAFWMSRLHCILVDSREVLPAQDTGRDRLMRDFPAVNARAMERVLTKLGFAAVRQR